MTTFKLLGATGALLLATSSLASAQSTNLCGGVGGAGAWIGGSLGTSDVTDAIAPFQTAAQIPLGGHAVILFQISQPTDVRVEVAPQGTDGDTVLQLYASDGSIVVEDDDSGGNLAARAEVSLAPGEYCLAARSFENQVITADVRVGLLEHEALTPGLDGGGGADFGGTCGPDTPAETIGNEAFYQGMLGNPITVSDLPVNTPFYRFELGEPLPLSLTAVGFDADPVLTLFDEFGNILAENDDFDGLNSRIDMTAPLAAGSYCIGVRDIGTGINPITVSIGEYDPVAARLGMINRAELAPSPQDDVPVTDLGVLPPAHFVDVPMGADAVWHRLRVEQGGLLLIEGIAIGDTDPMLTLFDWVGREIAWNDDADGLSSRLAERLTPGEYLLAVHPVPDTPQGTVRLVIERFVPARD